MLNIIITANNQELGSRFYSFAVENRLYVTHVPNAPLSSLEFCLHASVSV